MTRRPRESARWWVVFVFAAGMAWVESASVYYLRVLVDRIEPYQPHPLPIHGVLGPVEIVREAATLAMLLTVGILAGRTWPRRIGYMAIAFGVWDILYYAFLRLISGWPTSVFDWDILFLLPLPWWGPVLAPVCIAALMVVWGTCTTQVADELPGQVLEARAPGKFLGFGYAGIALALYVFMADALRAAARGLDVREVLPAPFDWPTFCAALLLMAVPVGRMVWGMRQADVDIDFESEYIRQRRNYSRIDPEPHAEAEER